MEQLLLKVRTGLGKAPGRTVRVPYGPMRGGLIVLEALLGGRSPVSAGQLSSFVQNGVAEPDAFSGALVPGMASVERMVALAGPRG